MPMTMINIFYTSEHDKCISVTNFLTNFEITNYLKIQHVQYTNILHLSQDIKSNWAYLIPCKGAKMAIHIRSQIAYLLYMYLSLYICLLFCTFIFKLLYFKCFFSGCLKLMAFN